MLPHRRQAEPQPGDLRRLGRQAGDELVRNDSEAARAERRALPCTARVSQLPLRAGRRLSRSISRTVKFSRLRPGPDRTRRAISLRKPGPQPVMPEKLAVAISASPLKRSQTDATSLGDTRRRIRCPSDASPVSPARASSSDVSPAPAVSSRSPDTHRAPARTPVPSPPGSPRLARSPSAVPRPLGRALPRRPCRAPPRRRLPPDAAAGERAAPIDPSDESESWSVGPPDAGPSAEGVWPTADPCEGPGPGEATTPSTPASRASIASEKRLPCGRALEISGGEKRNEQGCPSRAETRRAGDARDRWSWQINRPPLFLNGAGSGCQFHRRVRRPGYFHARRCNRRSELLDRRSGACPAALCFNASRSRTASRTATRVPVSNSDSDSGLGQRLGSLARRARAKQQRPGEPSCPRLSGRWACCIPRNE